VDSQSSEEAEERPASTHVRVRVLVVPSRCVSRKEALMGRMFDILDEQGVGPKPGFVVVPLNGNGEPMVEQTVPWFQEKAAAYALATEWLGSEECMAAGAGVLVLRVPEQEVVFEVWPGGMWGFDEGH
jgi:hypothetical protein